MIEKTTLKTLTDAEYVAPGRSGCAGCAAMLALRLSLKATGANTMLLISTGCVISNITHAGAPCVPFIHSLLPATGAMLSGVDAGLRVKHKRERVNLLGFSGDGGTADIGFQSLSGAVERGHRFVYVCYDNEGYMNTGGQRSGTTPDLARTSITPTGLGRDVGLAPSRRRKDMVRIMAAHGIPYAATASVGYPIDLVRKVRKGLASDGPAYIHVLSPCPYRWGFPEDQSLEVARLAVHSRIAPLYEIESGSRLVLQYKNKSPKPVADYLSKQGRFRHLFDEGSDPAIGRIQQAVDDNWAKLEAWAAGHAS